MRAFHRRASSLNRLHRNDTNILAFRCQRVLFLLSSPMCAMFKHARFVFNHCVFWRGCVRWVRGGVIIISICIIKRFVIVFSVTKIFLKFSMFWQCLRVHWVCQSRLLFYLVQFAFLSNQFVIAVRFVANILTCNSISWTMCFKTVYIDWYRVQLRVTFSFIWKSIVDTEICVVFRWPTKSVKYRLKFSHSIDKNHSAGLFGHFKDLRPLNNWLDICFQLANGALFARLIKDSKMTRFRCYYVY